jgi:hypothetical protein
MDADLEARIKQNLNTIKHICPTTRGSRLHCEHDRRRNDRNDIEPKIDKTA